MHTSNLNCRGPSGSSVPHASPENEPSAATKSCPFDLRVTEELANPHMKKRYRLLNKIGVLRSSKLAEINAKQPLLVDDGFKQEVMTRATYEERVTVMRKVYHTWTDEQELQLEIEEALLHQTTEMVSTEQVSVPPSPRLQLPVRARRAEVRASTNQQHRRITSDMVHYRQSRAVSYSSERQVRRSNCNPEPIMTANTPSLPQRLLARWLLWVDDVCNHRYFGLDVEKLCYAVTVLLLFTMLSSAVFMRLECVR